MIAPSANRITLLRDRDGEAADDDHEDEQVVDREAVLGDPAGEELAAVPRPGDVAQPESEPDGEDATGPGGIAVSGTALGGTALSGTALGGVGASTVGTERRGGWGLRWVR